MSRSWNVAVAGATGAVGNQMIRCLEERDFPIKNIRFLASARSVGKTLPYKGKAIPVEELKENSFQDMEIALFSAGASTSLKFAPHAAQTGCVVIDNSSAFRMDPKIPLVVPECNPHRIVAGPGIIANPNCSTIQMVVALKPIHNQTRIKRIIVSTYQAVSGTGQKAIFELKNQITDLLAGKEPEMKVYPYQIAYNCLPHIDIFLENDYTKEEMKMVNETRKILEDDSIRISATTVRVPVFYGHSEAVYIETDKKITPQEVKDLLRTAPGVVVMDDVANKVYPTALVSEGKDEVFVGRIREDLSHEKGIAMWVVSDNIRKGAATNAVQIAELWAQRAV
ncbi:MAG: aspartate-semialdehyde dehydrogenase [Deltaproteobacteria bacterium RBG_13_43_22]|nr:MAG: aspartate-semialdehyde dehydrogenase [Deltaproteobacteria bacterium RBG_13_43_22]